MTKRWTTVKTVFTKCCSCHSIYEHDIFYYPAEEGACVGCGHQECKECGHSDCILMDGRVLLEIVKGCGDK
jgi:hypothetical protein